MRLIVSGTLLGALAGAPAVADDWAHYGGDAGGQRYSAAVHITPANVDELTIAWTYRTGDLERRGDAMHRSAFEATPVLAGGQLLLCTPFNEVIALDPASGAERWRFDPQIATDYHPANQFTCRGVTAWSDPLSTSGSACATRIFMGTADSRLLALDADSGRPCTGFGEAGTVRRVGTSTRSRAAPRIFRPTGPPTLPR